MRTTSITRTAGRNLAIIMAIRWICRICNSKRLLQRSVIIIRISNMIFGHRSSSDRIQLLGFYGLLNCGLLEFFLLWSVERTSFPNNWSWTNWILKLRGNCPWMTNCHWQSVANRLCCQALSNLTPIILLINYCDSLLITINNVQEWLQ